MKYLYPVSFTFEDGVYNVAVPDLPGCFTFGSSLPEAIDMARDAMCMWLIDAENKGERIPEARHLDACPANNKKQFYTLLDADTADYRKKNDSRAVKKTLTLPSWLNEKAEAAGVNFSQVLQEGLKVRLGLPKD